MKEALEKLNNEMSVEHSKVEDAIHNWLCDQTEDMELMNAVLTEGKSIKSSMGYVMKKVKESSKGNMAMMTDVEVFKLIREYYLGAESFISQDPSVNVKMTAEQKHSIEETKEHVVKEIKVSLDKKSKLGLETIINLDVSDEDKLRMIRSLNKQEEVIEEKKEDENLSLFDF